MVVVGIVKIAHPTICGGSLRGEKRVNTYKSIKRIHDMRSLKDLSNII
jgi:hypothetical protein